MTMTETNRKLCSLQGEIFEASIDAVDASSAVFVRRFMNSDIARRLDAGSIVFETATAEQMAREADEGYGSAKYGSTKYTDDEMHWMGYLYRCMCCATGMSSKAAYRTISARELRGLYAPYHTLDPERAVQEILEMKGRTPVDLQAAVKALADIRSRRSARGLSW